MINISSLCVLAEAEATTQLTLTSLPGSTDCQRILVREWGVQCQGRYTARVAMCVCELARSVGPTE